MVKVVARRWSTRGLVAALGGACMAAAVLGVDGLQDDSEAADVAVVLGNAVEDGGPSPRLAARLERAAELARAGTVPWVIVSGGVEPGGQDEAAVMRTYLVQHGVSAQRILVDSQGDTTADTARTAARWMRERGWQRAVVVSQFFHVPRARLALENCGVANVRGAAAHYFELRDVYALAREVVAWPVYAWRGCAR